LDLTGEDKIHMGEQLIFNGINGATGAYLLPPMTPEELSAIAKGDAQDDEHLYDLKLRYRQSTKPKRGVKAGVDALKLSSAGWGIIFAKEDGKKIPEIKEALSGLLDLRRFQARDLYKEFSDEGGYQRGENYLNFLARHNIGPGPADPERVPYYLLIVGDAETIPFDFQYQLDVQYAVGRIYFDTIDQYAQYAQSVVKMETDHNALPRQATFFGVQNQDDKATQLSALHLVQPLAEKVANEQVDNHWEINTIIGDDATKTALNDVFGGEHSPALLFSASHGMGFPKDDPRQIPHQGALLCQDWPGPQAWREPIPEDYYFSADDIPSDAHLSGSIAFHFACYGAGTPQMDDFAHQTFRDPVAIASQPFIARLPQKLLSHPNGGMQAVIGHVERAWGYSFVWENAGSQLAVFESALKRIMDGFPVGYAMEFFDERYAELSTVLSNELQGVQFGKEVDDIEIAGMWTAHNDARSYVIIGDPAVRIPVSQSEQHDDQATQMATVTGKVGGVQTGSVYRPQATDLEESQDWNEGGRLIELNLKALEQLSEDDTVLQKANLIAKLGNSFTQLHLGSRVDNLKAAIAEYQTALGLLSPDKRSDEWRQIQTHLANTFKELYSSTGEARYADYAKQAYSTVIEIPIIDETQDEWVVLNLNLADLYTLMFKQVREIKLAEQALEAYQSVLKVKTRQSAPFVWGLIHYNLANLQFELLSDNGEEHLRLEAIENFQIALEIYKAELFPYQFADIYIKLGDLYLGQAAGDQAESIEHAIQAYEFAQEEISKLVEVIPESFILTRLGGAYSQRLRGDRAKNVTLALAYYKQCLAIMHKKNDHEGIDDIEMEIIRLETG
jgi:tetratricopeptide (TPR) repeat protein